MYTFVKKLYDFGEEKEIKKYKQINAFFNEHLNTFLSCLKEKVK